MNLFRRWKLKALDSKLQMAVLIECSRTLGVELGSIARERAKKTM